ncbi:MAG TPA: alpha/beta fold hydrolase [Gemmatimonadaceae bacterium]|nr:alpha/beta fold hydrolase [Gemmatimonadaceae bacterium]
MTPLLILGLAVAGVVVVRVIVTRRAEGRDAGRPRSANGVVSGADGFAFDRPGAPAVLLLHGAGDTPQTLRALGEFLHARGFAVAAPLLPGHGRSVRDFRHVTSAAWRATALEAYDELRAAHRWTGIVGLSMGGALAVLTAVERPETPALVLLAPYLGLPPGLRAAAMASRAAGLVVPYFSSEDNRSIRDPAAAAEGLAYGVFTPAALRALRAVADEAAAALPRVRTPTLIVQSRQDNRVAPAVAERAQARLGAADKQLEWVSDGGHVITVDYGRARVFTLAADWLAAHGAGALLPW